MANAEMLKKLNQVFDDKIELGTYTPSLSERKIGCKIKAEVFMIDGTMVADPIYGYAACEQLVRNFLRNRDGWAKSPLRNKCNKFLLDSLDEDLKEAIQKGNFKDEKL